MSYTLVRKISVWFIYVDEYFYLHVSDLNSVGLIGQCYHNNLSEKYKSLEV